MYFLQTSAKSCDNVDRLFTEIAHELLQQVFVFSFVFLSVFVQVFVFVFVEDKEYMLEIDWKFSR